MTNKIKNFNKKFNWNIIKQNKYIVIFSLLLIFGSICFITGCFVPHNNTISKVNTQPNKISFKYKNFVKAWNNILLKNQYFATFDIRKLLLPTTNNQDVIKKLNQIFNPNRINIQIKKYKKLLTNDEMLNLPLKEYIHFLKNLHFKQNQFSTNLSQKDLEKLISFMLQSNYNYLNFNTIRKLTWTYSFKYYFKDNIKYFEEKGFSKNLDNYNKYISLINSK